MVGHARRPVQDRTRQLNFACGTGENSVNVRPARPKILLIHDCAENVKSVKKAVASAKVSCCLRTVGAGVSTLAYLRRRPPYSDAPDPDLILFDLSDPQARNYKLLDAIKADRKLSAKPIVLLTSDHSEVELTAKYEKRRKCAMFSPLRLESFLRSMKSLNVDRYLRAVQYIEQFGFVLARMPTQNDQVQSRQSSLSRAAH